APVAPAEPPAATTTAGAATSTAGEPAADANTGDQATAAAGAAAAADAAAGAEGDELTPAEIEAAATALLELSWQKLGPELDKGGIPTAVAQRALDIELTKPEADQKLTIVKKLRASLGVE
ncbi:MAG: hypothetical protein ACREO0_04625, partial [Pseudoxanthomonas sp.]